MKEVPNEFPEKKIQAPHLAEEIRVNELARLARRRRRTDDAPEKSRRARLPAGMAWAIAALVVFFAAAFGASYYFARRAIQQSISERAGMFQEGVRDLKNFDLSSAQKAFGSAGDGNFSISGAWGLLGQTFSGASDAARAFADLAVQFSHLSQEASSLMDDAFGALAGPQQGSPLADDLTALRATLGSIDGDAGSLSATMSSLGSASGLMNGGSSTEANYLALLAQVRGAEKFLDAFIPWFSDASSTHHVLVLLENPSEMRPGGGFLGSYADVSLRGGSITGIDVHDVADADVAFTQKIIPPQPLQLEQTGWRPADANWFFDFPTSASKTIQLFEASGMYAASSTQFDAAIAITPQAMSDVLSVTGPIAIPNSAIGAAPANQSTTFTADDFIQEIQNVVQQGQQKSSGNAHPKAVLGILWQQALGKIASLTGDQKQELLGDAIAWVANKDAMVYFQDPTMEAFVKTYGAAGDEYAMPQDFNGDYLAVANADINADKSELYIDQAVSLDVELGNDGVATDHLSITRTHHGDQSSYWWYKTTNQDYLQIFVPAGSSLGTEGGGFVKTVSAPVNYAKLGYLADPLVLSMQSSTRQNFAYPAVGMRTGGAADPGRTVFSVWSRTYAGSSTNITFDYSHPLFAQPADGVQYQFVIERPSGATGRYVIEIDAPPGYVFKENGLSAYTDAEESIPGRMTITLTLQKP